MSGVAESVAVVDGETVARVRVGAPTDADVETLRRAMVEAHQTLAALDRAMASDHTWAGVHGGIDRARLALVAAAKAYEDAVYLAKRARGAP